MQRSIPFLEVIPENKIGLSSVYIEHQFLPKKAPYWHYHPEIEILYVIAGTGIRQIGDNIGNFKPGDLYICGNNIPHDFHVDKEGAQAEFIFFQFKAEILENLGSEFNLINSFLKDTSKGILIEDFYCSQIQALTGYKSMSPIMTICKILELLEQITQPENATKAEILSTVNFLNYEEKNKSSDNRLNKVTEYIQTNYFKNIHLEDVAEIAFMTPSSFSRYFKSKMNKNFKDYLNEFRVQESCKQLIASNKSLQVISAECGFETYSTFVRAFNKHKNIPPSEYKKLTSS